jgi:hypothetical protein
MSEGEGLRDEVCERENEFIFECVREGHCGEVVQVKSSHSDAC